MRTFIGMEFGRDTKERIAEVQSVVRENAIKGRFKYIGNFHLTLKFLGEVEDGRTADIGRSLKAVALRHEKLRLYIDRIGYFDGRGSIHALWLGVSGELEKLGLMYSDIDESMGRMGFRKEAKAYTPHITIAQDLTLKIPFEELKARIRFEGFQPIVIKEISLIKSEELNGKRIYTPLSSFQLG